MPGIDRRLIQNFEWPLFALAMGVCTVGIINLVSAAPGGIDGGLPPTAARQVMWLGVGVAGLVGALLPDYRSLERFAVPIYVAGIGLLVAVLLFAPVINGSQRWLVFPFGRFQPSEIMKLAMLILFARLLARRNATSPMGLFDLIGPGVLIAIPVALVLRQPDLGTALLIALAGGSYLFIARVRIASIATLAFGGLAASAGAWLFYLHDYQKERVLTFLDPDRDPLGAAYHAIQSQIAVGSGGLFGQGFGKGPQSQLDFLPEQQTDFVFSVLAEEWGFVGAAFVLFLYLGVVIRGIMIAHASKDLFGTYLAVGLVTLFFWAGAINVGMVIGIMPVVGVPLPFLSHGGSSLLTCLLAIGLLMNISMRRYTF